ncbi:MAG: hypothetical protein KDC99_00175 [Cyclobacteriaceae bacterium]|nr:hypothetical protein [Cyclobacteriaceae bacterium]
MQDKPETQPIHQAFFNSETGQPFATCLMCNNELKDTQYVIEKAFKKHPSHNLTEVIFEYAMCVQCATKMHMELSEESRKRIEEYMAAMPRGDRNFTSIEDAISHCAIKNSLVNDSTEYSIYCLCNGNEMVVGDLPYALSGEVQDEIMQLLSAKSLDILDDFIGNHFSGPPEVREILRRRPVLI